MYKLLQGSLTAFFSLLILSASGQRQELSISPTGFFLPRIQLLQYERYVDSRQSLTFSVGYNGEQRSQFLSRYVASFSSTRGVFGYRRYFPIVDLGLDDDLAIFASVRAVVEYSTMQLQSDSRLSIPTDSLRASGISLAPEFLWGGKLTLFKRVTLAGAIGAQYYVKLLPTAQITRNQAFWKKVNSEDSENWQANRNNIINYRRGLYPSVQITVGVVLGKRK